MSELDNLIIEDIKAKTKRYLGFAENSKNRFDVVSFNKIVDSVQDEFKEANDEIISEFFFTYYDFDVFNIEKRVFEEKMNKIFSQYLSREAIVLSELEDISTYLSHIQMYRADLQKDFHKIDGSFLSLFKQKQLSDLKIQLNYLAMVEVELKTASLRRARWGLDLIIGDFYIIILTFYYLIKVSKNRTFMRTTTLVLLSGIVHLVKDVKKFYSNEERIFLEKFFLYEFEKIYNLEA